MTALQRSFFHRALEFVGAPYVWGGQGEGGVDCSGLVIECIRAVPGFSQVPDATAESIRHDYCEVRANRENSQVRLGFLIGPKQKATHVVVFFPRSMCYIHASGSNNIVEVEASEENYSEILQLDWGKLIEYYGPPPAAPTAGRIPGENPTIPGNLKRL